MDKLKVESQWNGTKDMMLNIPHFPHLHSTLTDTLTDYTRYPHPYEYFLSSLCGIITLIIYKFSEEKCIIITNLYITISASLSNEIGKITNIEVNIKLDSSVSPDELTSLQNLIYQNDTMVYLFDKDIINVNWD